MMYKLLIEVLDILRKYDLNTKAVTLMMLHFRYSDMIVVLLHIICHHYFLIESRPDTMWDTIGTHPSLCIRLSVSLTNKFVSSLATIDHPSIDH
jgi:hypothetical protein